MTTTSSPSPTQRADSPEWLVDILHRNNDVLIRTNDRLAKDNEWLKVLLKVSVVVIAYLTLQLYARK